MCDILNLDRARRAIGRCVKNSSRSVAYRLVVSLTQRILAYKLRTNNFAITMHIHTFHTFLVSIVFDDQLFRQLLRHPEGW